MVYEELKSSVRDNPLGQKGDRDALVEQELQDTAAEVEYLRRRPEQLALQPLVLGRPGDV
jgi:hypothetical protein